MAMVPLPPASSPRPLHLALRRGRAVASASPPSHHLRQPSLPLPPPMTAAMGAQRRGRKAHRRRCARMQVRRAHTRGTRRASAVRRIRGPSHHTASKGLISESSPHNPLPPRISQPNPPIHPFSAYPGGARRRPGGVRRGAANSTGTGPPYPHNSPSPACGRRSRGRQKHGGGGVGRIRVREPAGIAAGVRRRRREWRPAAPAASELHSAAPAQRRRQQQRRRRRRRGRGSGGGSGRRGRLLLPRRVTPPPPSLLLTTVTV
jgi:hypothetical protein